MPITSILKEILTWPMVGFQKKAYLGLAVGAGAMYYYLGEVPSFERDTMDLARAYAMGGVAFVAEQYIEGKKSQSDY